MQLGAAQITDAWLKVDAAMGVKKFATSGVATGVFNGDLILETSTGKSMIFNSSSWVSIYNSNDGQGKSQASNLGSADIFPDPIAETLIFTKNLNVEAGRKYLAHISMALTAVNTGGDPLANRGYWRFIFYYTTNLAGTPNIFIHDIASHISAVNTSRSKNLKAMFEFFPNLTGTIKFGMSSLAISGNENLELNLSGANPNITFIDWGV
jgi:hypothetical protein